MQILVDTREQRPLSFKLAGNVSKVRREYLDFGDYACEFETGERMPIYFERKGMQDLFSTLSNRENIELHKAKIRRAESAGAKLYLIIEGTLSDVYDGTKYCKLEGAQIAKTVFTFMVKYGLHPIFCIDRDEMRDFMVETWEAWGRNWKKLPQATEITNSIPTPLTADVLPQAGLTV